MAGEPGFLHRWSRRKHEAARAAEQAPPLAAPPAPPPAAEASVPAAAPPVIANPSAAPAAEAPPLPPVESLTIDSDFTPFLSCKVEETVKRAALRKLFSDPHFNVMDGLDVYIDDYSKPDPVPPGFLDKLADVYKTVEEKAAEVTGAVEPASAETVAAAATELPPATESLTTELPPDAAELPPSLASAQDSHDDRRG